MVLRNRSTLNLEHYSDTKKSKLLLHNYNSFIVPTGTECYNHANFSLAPLFLPENYVYDTSTPAWCQHFNKMCEATQPTGVAFFLLPTMHVSIIHYM